MTNSTEWYDTSEENWGATWQLWDTGELNWIIEWLTVECAWDKGRAYQVNLWHTGELNWEINFTCDYETWVSQNKDLPIRVEKHRWAY